MNDAAWVVVYSRQAQKDAKKLSSSGLKKRAQQLLEVLAADPFASPPRYEKLVGNLAGHTPATVHDGSWVDIQQTRQATMDTLRDNNP